MLPAKNYKKALIKPLPLEKFVKTKHESPNSSLFRTLLATRKEDSRKISGSIKRHSVPANLNLTEQPDQVSKDESPLDYTIDESDDEDDNCRRKSLSSIGQRTITPPSKLKDLLKTSSLDFVKKRKRRPPDPPGFLVTPLTPTKQYDGIDESSPVKKAKSILYADQSSIFLTRTKRSPVSKRQEKIALNSSNQTLVEQLKALIEKERTSRTIWRHSVTSQLKNKFKETVKGRDTLNLRLINYRTKLAIPGLHFANGVILETTIQSAYTIGETVQLLFPASLSENMGLSNNLIIQFTSPWNVITIHGRNYLINPFWISVIDRCLQPDGKNKLSTLTEITQFTWACPCRQSLGTIDSLDCNEAYSQKSQPLKETV